MRKFIGLSLSLLLVLLVYGCDKKVINTWDEIESRGYVIVGLDDTFAPMGFRDNQGNIVGFDVDLAKEVFNRLGVEVRFQPIDWDSKVLELNSGTIDMIWNGLSITEERQEQMLFSIPYLANRQIILISQTSNISQISDLSGKKVGVQISSAAEDAVKANSVSSSFASLIKYDQYTQALLELKNGSVDAVVIDEIMGRYIISQSDGEYRVANENFGEETFGIGFRKASDSIRNQINLVLEAMISDGTASQISIQWFDEDIFLK